MCTASFPPLQVPDAAGERGGLQPPQPTLPRHPDVAGSARCCPRERDRADGQRDQPVAAMGGEPARRNGGPRGAGVLVLGTPLLPQGGSGQRPREPFPCVQR